MNDSYKIRELVDKHPEDKNVVLNDLISNLIKLQVPLGKLEIHNYKDAITDSLKLLSEHENLVKLLKRRLRNEVRVEVLKWHKEKPKKKINIHPNSLKNLNKPKK